MDSSGAPAPGWFTDPEDPSAQRWWSGEAWTEYTRAPAAAPVATLLEERIESPEPSFPGEPALPVPAAYAEPAAPAAFAEPVATVPAAAAADGFVMPDLSADPLIAPLAPEPYPVAPPAAAAASVPPVPLVPTSPLGFPSTADPDIAQHYRKVLSAPEPASSSLAPVRAGSPAQEGWGGMPLPSAGGAGAYNPAGEYRAPDSVRSTSSYAAARTAASNSVSIFDNKMAKVALSTGLSSLAALAFIFFGRILIVPSLLSLVAIITGIIGLALVKRAGSGLWPALGGLLMGLTTAIAVGASIVFAVLEAATVDTAEIEAQIVAESADYYGIDVVTANCPSEVSIFTTNAFTCTAIDSSGVAYLVDVEIDSDGFVWWDLRV